MKNVQTEKQMAFMLQDQVQYIMQPKIRYTPETGSFVSYDIAAYDCYTDGIVETVRSVTADRNFALQLVEKFNRCQLSPCHLRDAILDMLP